MDKNWKGPSYSPISLIWVPRNVYVMEATPKDPYYNYGKYVMYIDKELHWIWMKDMWDKSGQYWKTQLEPNKKTVLSSNGQNVTSWTCMDYYLDWRAKHSLAVIVGQGAGAITQSGNLPENVVSPNFFNESNLKQITK